MDPKFKTSWISALNYRALILYTESNTLTKDLIVLIQKNNGLARYFATYEPGKELCLVHNDGHNNNIAPGDFYASWWQDSNTQPTENQIVAWMPAEPVIELVDLIYMNAELEQKTSLPDIEEESLSEISITGSNNESYFDKNPAATDIDDSDKPIKRSKKLPTIKSSNNITSLGDKES